MKTIKIQSPITGDFLYQVEPAASDQIEAVFDRARSIQPMIAAMSVPERVAQMVKISDYIIAHQEEIIDRLVLETGKSRMDALSTELFEICDGFDYYRDHAQKILADRKTHTPLVLMGKKSKVIFEPLGVVLVIAPWNYPLIQCLIPSLSAFLAGNAVIFKPSEVTPLKGLYETILTGAGFTPGAIQIVYGGKDTGASLIEQRPDKIHFTGSTRGGRQVMAAAAKHLIPVDLELGGKDPAIVFEDVNIEKTANGVVWAAFTNAGQSCTSIERCYVQETIYDNFVEKAVALTKQLRHSTPERDPSAVAQCDIGCMTAEFQLKIIEAQLTDAVEKGAQILCGGERIAGSLHFPPTIVIDVDHQMQLGSEETFGPILPIMKFSTEEEVVRLANDSPYGLSASVWSKDLIRADRVARAIKTGNVSINNHMLTEGNPALPFGGVKESGFGRYKGEWGLRTFCNIKAIISSPNNDAIEPHWYPQTITKYDLFTRLIQSFFTRPRKWLKFLTVGLSLDSLGSKEKIQ